LTGYCFPPKSSGRMFKRFFGSGLSLNPGLSPCPAAHHLDVAGGAARRGSRPVCIPVADGVSAARREKSDCVAGCIDGPEATEAAFPANAEPDPGSVLANPLISGLLSSSRSVLAKS
jgi:hypothetical protein